MKLSRRVQLGICATDAAEGIATLKVLQVILQNCRNDPVLRAPPCPHPSLLKSVNLDHPKGWVGGLEIPRGALHGMDVDGVVIPDDELPSPCYIKYNSGTRTFADVRANGGQVRCTT